MTAVEKLEISLLGIISFDSEELRAKYKERIAKAKEMEKEHIIQGDVYPPQFVIDKAEQYYNETFKNK